MNDLENRQNSFPLFQLLYRFIMFKSIWNDVWFRCFIKPIITWKSY